MSAPCDPFIARFATPLAADPPVAGHLAGLTVAAKDNFDISGHVTGAGNPEYAAAHAPATANAPLVDALLASGATIVGKAQMDELAYSLMGVNARYGTPPNPAAPLRVPGGSSSGSASAVAMGLADLGLGTDTGGSARIPAAFCGLFGWRPTHGLLPSGGMVPLAPSYDTPGFLARDLATLARVIDVLLPPAPEPKATRFRTPADVWSLAQPTTSAVLRATLPPEMLEDTGDLLPSGRLSDWLETFRVHQAYEIWQALGPFVAAHHPDFGPGIRERFAMAAAIAPETFAKAAAGRRDIRILLDRAIPPGTILILPTAPGPAPLRDAPAPTLDAFRNAALNLLCIAGHGGLPQITVPVALVDGAPVGLSLVGARGSDRHLMQTAARLLSRTA